jgi:Uma2 family endonuclease
MAGEHSPFLTVEEYFQLEEHDPHTLYEYEDGSVYVMSGGSANHDTIKSNLHRILWNALHGGNCRVYTSDMKVPVTDTRYYHPDVIVTCNPRDRGTTQVIRSPRLVVEVLSPSTEMIDRTRKLKYYRAHPTIEEYLLIDSRSFKAEVYTKGDGKWIYDAFERDDEIILPNLDVRFPLIDAYLDVEFAELLSEMEDEEA